MGDRTFKAKKIILINKANFLLIFFLMKLAQAILKELFL